MSISRVIVRYVGGSRDGEVLDSESGVIEEGTHPAWGVDFFFHDSPVGGAAMWSVTDAAMEALFEQGEESKTVRSKHAREMYKLTERSDEDGCRNYVLTFAGNVKSN